MKGYWSRPEATAAAIRDGWFLSGDLGRVDEDGYFCIVDRKKDMIIRGGYNVYPREVEDLLHEHPAVREAAVIGVPHDELGRGGRRGGRRSSRAARPRRGVAPGSGAARRLQVPTRVWFVDELPKGPTGKILKREIEVPTAGQRDQPYVDWRNGRSA